MIGQIKTENKNTLANNLYSLGFALSIVKLGVAFGLVFYELMYTAYNGYSMLDLLIKMIPVGFGVYLCILPTYKFI